jgi:FkbM family methyltransferase
MNLSRFVMGYQRYGNPWQLLAQRVLGRRLKLFNVKDRATGVACWCTPDSHRMFAEVWFYKSYDVPGVPLRPGDLVLDIGANQGFFSCYAAHKGARVIAFEPCRNSFALLERNLARNDFSDPVSVRPEAVGAESGVVDFFISPMLGGGMNTTSAVFASEFDHIQSEKVPCVTLTDVLREIDGPRIRLCKIDCEGAELEILRALDPDDTAIVDAFALEYHSAAYRVNELIDCMLQWGTHEVAFASASGGAPLAVIHAIAKDALREYAAGIDRESICGRPARNDSGWTGEPGNS